MLIPSQLDYKERIQWNLRTLKKLHSKINVSFMLRRPCHYGDVIMGTVASQFTSLAIVYSTVYSGANQRKHQSSASLAFVRLIHRGPVNSPHIWPVTRKMFPFDDVIMFSGLSSHMFIDGWQGSNSELLFSINNILFHTLSIILANSFRSHCVAT